MDIKQADFVKSAVNEKDYPEALNKMEFAFVGRSNVGKSSLINSLTGRKKLAKTSKTPGRTQLVNFFLINNEFNFVDLPGYGYSKMSKAEQVKVGNFIEQYLQIRKEIALIIFLIDIRHEPTANDRLMYDYIINKSGNHPCIVIANKADKLAPTKVANAVKDLQNSLNPLKDLTFLPFSAEKKTYCEDVWKEIEKHIL